jgi:hypothetical protein
MDYGHADARGHANEVVSVPTGYRRAIAAGSGAGGGVIPAWLVDELHRLGTGSAALHSAVRQ